MNFNSILSTGKIMRNLLNTSIVAVSIAITGCATLPTPEEMQQVSAGFVLPQMPEEGKSIVYIVRPGSVGGLIRFKVFIDDREDESQVGHTRGNQYIYFNLEPGDHRILSKAENWSEVSMSANPGDIIFIRQDAQMGIFIARNSIYLIPEYEGKYHVKMLELGTIIKSDNEGS